MTEKLTRPNVRFLLGSLQKNSPATYMGTSNGESEKFLDAGRDSGAPSPELPPLAAQPASLRLAHTKQRVELLGSISIALEARARHEAARGTLARLRGELRSKYDSRARACRNEKASRLASTRRLKGQLESERDTLMSRAEAMREHALQHAKQHEAHGASKDEPLPVTTPARDKKPSRRADQRLAASRLLREVQQLRGRLTTLEGRLTTEAKRKKQAEEELTVLRAALARQKGNRSALKPIQTNRT